MSPWLLASVQLEPPLRLVALSRSYTLPPPSASAPSFRSIFHPRLGRTLLTQPTPAPKRGLKWCLRENQKHYRLYLLKCVVLLSLLSVLASTIFVLLISKNASFTISFPLFFFFFFLPPPLPPFLVKSSFLNGWFDYNFSFSFFFFLSRNPFVDISSSYFLDYSNFSKGITWLEFLLSISFFFFLLVSLLTFSRRLFRDWNKVWNLLYAFVTYFSLYFFFFFLSAVFVSVTECAWSLDNLFFGTECCTVWRSVKRVAATLEKYPV